MPEYIGVKRVNAAPMTKVEFHALQNLKMPEENEDGYIIEYKDGGKPNNPNFRGYISWSPRKVFEKSYFLIGDTDSVADILYASYGTAKNWTRSNGEKMETSLDNLPLDCQAAWQAVAEIALKLL